MTTVAWRSGILAADTLIAYGSYTNGDREKIAQCGNYHAAVAGPAWVREPLEEWLRSGARRKNCPNELLDNEEAFATIIMNGHGAIFDFTRGYLIPICADYAAIGSGGHMALGAMAHGATAIQAVRAACKHDKSSGGRITHVAATSN